MAVLFWVGRVFPNLDLAIIPQFQSFRRQPSTKTPLLVVTMLRFVVVFVSRKARFAQ